QGFGQIIQTKLDQGVLANCLFGLVQHFLGCIANNCNANAAKPRAKIVQTYILSGFCHRHFPAPEFRCNCGMVSGLRSAATSELEELTLPYPISGSFSDRVNLSCSLILQGF